ncbi:MAG TPA: aldehyde dehydrogenase family protein, partial [Burkholderiaceae bacterium]|nr:aldehyde dehydrogenase family protein [Burkholderiaceae bacterium]
MSTLTVINPANGATIAELPQDNAQLISAKYSAARAAQPAWANRLLQDRIDMLRDFRDALASDVERL